MGMFVIIAFNHFFY